MRARRAETTLAALTVALMACGEQVALDPAREELADAVASDVDGERVFGEVAALVAAHRDDAPIDCRRFEDPDPVACHLTHRAAREWLASRFRELGYEVRREHARDRGLELENVIAVLPGSTREVVVVGAHYDAGYAAADDNSTGVGVLVELARVFRARRLERTLHFVGFDLEELGLAGSTAYARAHAGEPVAVFVLDSVGYTAAAQPTYPGIPLPATGDFLLVAGNDASIDLAANTRALARALDLGRVEAVIAPGDGTTALTTLFDLASSDHAPFWATDVPAVQLTDTGPARHDGYHSPDDTLARLDRTFLAANTRVAAAAVAYTAGIVR